MLAPLHLVAVGVRTLAHQHLASERGQGVAESALIDGQRGGELEPEHPQSLRAVEDRHPAVRNRVIGLDRLAPGKRAPGDGTGDGDRAIGMSAVTSVVGGLEERLPVVDQPHRHVDGTDRNTGPTEQIAHPIGRQHVRGLQRCGENVDSADDVSEARNEPQLVVTRTAHARSWHGTLQGGGDATRLERVTRCSSTPPPVDGGPFYASSVSSSPKMSSPNEPKYAHQSGDSVRSVTPMKRSSSDMALRIGAPFVQHASTLDAARPVLTRG